MCNFNDKYNAYKTRFTAELDTFSSNFRIKPEVLCDSVKYSLLAGGKRFRPVLLLSASEFLGVDEKDAMPFALALECIHTYSLIHDDLPAMDNDDYRRGILTNHKVFGEDNAILAGDALLNLAYEVCFNECLKGREQVNASKYLSECAGVYGMICGQSADLLASKSTQRTVENLEFIHQNKTSKLIMAAFGVASYLSGGKYFTELEEFAFNLGLIFQITDDILDVKGSFEKMGKTLGKDKAENKLSYVSLFGLEKSKSIAEDYANKCKLILSSINAKNSFFYELIEYVMTRTA